MAGLWRVHESCEKMGRGEEERRDEKQMKLGSVGSSAGSSGSVLTYPQQKEAARVMYLGGKKT